MLDLGLRANSEELAPRYAAGDPFPHIVIDDLFAEPTLERVLADFPAPGDIPWVRFENEHREEARLQPSGRPCARRCKNSCGG